MMNEPRQKQFLSIGREGCYSLVVVHFAEDLTGTYIDNYLTYLEMRRTTVPGTKLPVLEENCYINDPGFLLSRLTNQKWTVTKEDLTYVLKPGELEATRYEKPDGSPHFVQTDGHGGVVWNPMGGSIDSAYKPVSKRVFRRT